MLNLDRRLIDDVYARLMISNDGLMADNLPQELNTIALSVPHTTLAQIALLSQFDEMMINQTPNSPLTHTPPLPTLNKSVIPSHLQRLAEQILTQNGLVYVVRTLMMIDERGYGVPPTVWLPPKSMMTSFDGGQAHPVFEGKLPESYLAWCAWVNGERDERVSDDVLTDENWHEWSSLARIRFLKDLRRTNPKSALDLIGRFAPKEPAEKRLDLVAVLAVGLCDDDKEFLESLSKDRSQKVKDEAQLLLARLGVYDESDSVVDELFDELEVGAGGIIFKDTKSGKRRENRYNHLQRVNLFALANKFELPLKDFLLAWDFDGNDRKMGGYDFNHLLITRTLCVLSDDELVEIAEPFIKMMIKQNRLNYWRFIRPRLPLVIRQEFAHKMLLRAKNFAYLIEITPDGLDMSFKTLQISGSYKALIQKIKKWQKTNTNYLNHGGLGEQVQALGLLVGQDVAKDCLNDLYELGVDKTDPALQTLTLNALLEPLKSP